MTLKKNKLQYNNGLFSLAKKKKVLSQYLIQGKNISLIQRPVQGLLTIPLIYMTSHNMLKPPHLQCLWSRLIDEVTTWMHCTYSHSAVRMPKFCPLDSARGGACSVESQSLWNGTWQSPVTALKYQQEVQVHRHTDLVRAHRKQKTEDMMRIKQWRSRVGQFRGM